VRGYESAETDERGGSYRLHMRIQVSIVDEHEAHEDETSLIISVPTADRGGPVDAETLARLVAALAAADQAGYRDRLVVKNGGRILLLRTSDVDWIEAEGNYVTHPRRQRRAHPARDDRRSRGAARPVALPSHPSLDDRKRRQDQGASAPDARRRTRDARYRSPS